MKFDKKRVFSVRLHPADFMQLKQISKKCGVSQSDFVRNAMQREFWRIEEKMKKVA